MNTIKIISDDDVKSILDLENTILCVENAYRQKADKRATLLPLVSADLVEGKADMDIKSGIYQTGNLFGLKLVTWFGDNKIQGLPNLTAMAMVFDLKNGFPIALINAGYLTAMRTGAAGAVGIKYLANQNAEVLTLVGTGNQAAFQIAAALTAVPTIRKVNIYNPRNEKKAHLLQQSIRTKLSGINNSSNDFKNENWIQRIKTVEFYAVNNIQSALEETDAVITITPSSQALIKKEWVKPGTHISCIGADLPGKQELDETLFRTARIFADDIDQASSVGEIQTAVSLGILPIESIREIGYVINGNENGRLSNNDITVFDSTGIALQDLAVADYIIRTAEEKNIGTSVTI
ncbi:ornithine cyclodeaminase family protein [Clostridium boliviensis]|uniref:Ornithine cyclodeaminase family protein n=1 Tax=Clostridium boliviensis TaxID=318465 RepID=A0ABU4GX73_9CLOT|nr:ornithine cyclodeaminase family protein [Clostridium boliviensis]MDW2800802.1 ornithine cyclodeaminase family protein [Clostridium boliviensis]